MIAHSAASRQIAEDSRVASWVGANVDDMWPAAEKVVDALEKWPLAAEANQTVCQVSKNMTVVDDIYLYIGIFTRKRHRSVVLL